MKKVVVLLVVVLMVSCHSEEKNETIKEIIMDENTEEPMVTGVGGIFFKCESPDNMKAWFSENLGLVTNEYGSLFEFNTSPNAKDKGYLQWSPFKNTTNYFSPSTKDLMINYRVNNLELFAEKLKEKNVTILDTIETYEYGKFLHILDAEDNKIELWEPIDNSFTKEYQGKNTVNVTIGGLFFKAKNPSELIKWYSDNLGIKTDGHGKMFNFFHPVKNDQMEFLQWSIFPDTTDYFEPSEASYMINYCVENLEDLVEKLKKNNVVFTDTITSYEYGSFVHVLAPENIKIELWQPNYNFGK